MLAASVTGGISGVGQSNKGIIANLTLGIKIVFQYNPKTLTDEIPVNWHPTDIQGQANPLFTYQNTGPHTKTFEILLDAHSSPHPEGHVASDINKIQMLTMPYYTDGRPTAIPSLYPTSATPTKSDQVVGVPPLVKIVYGSRVQKGMIRNIKIEEQLHGTTRQSQAMGYPTRARVTFDFYIVDDTRMLVNYKENAPKKGNPSVSVRPAYGPLGPFAPPGLPGLAGGGIGNTNLTP